MGVIDPHALKADWPPTDEPAKPAETKEPPMPSETIHSEGGVACIVVTPIGDAGRVNVVTKGYTNVNATFDRASAARLAFAILDAGDIKGRAAPLLQETPDRPASAADIDRAVDRILAVVAKGPPPSAGSEDWTTRQLIRELDAARADAEREKAAHKNLITRQQRERDGYRRKLDAFEHQATVRGAWPYLYEGRIGDVALIPGGRWRIAYVRSTPAGEYRLEMVPVDG